MLRLLAYRFAVRTEPALVRENEADGTITTLAPPRPKVADSRKR